MLVNPARATGSADHIHQNREANHGSIKSHHIKYFHYNEKNDPP